MNNNIQLSKTSQKLFNVESTAPSLVTSARIPRLTAGVALGTARGPWGWLPLLSLVSAVGLLLVAAADTLSRSGAGQYELLFWAGLLMVIVPIVARMASLEPSRRERIGLVVLVGLGIYLVKVMHSPYHFTFADEMIHAYNADKILQTGTLFSRNSILSVSALYPGLETVTAAFASLSGLSVFGAGLVIVGVARLILMLALYFLYEEVSGSARLAGIATLLYAATANYVFFSVEFSYESLALPLAVFVLFIAARRAAAYKSAHHPALTVIAVLGILAVVITHHLTAYFLAAFFIMWSVLLLVLRLGTWARASLKSASGDSKRWKVLAFVDRMTQLGPHPSMPQRDPERYRGLRSFSEPAMLAVIATAACLVWLIGVASLTVGYLSPVLGGAVSSIIDTIGGEASTRQLFQSTTGYLAPLWERLTGISSVLLLLLAMPFGLRGIWKRFRGHPIVILFAAAALVYFAILGMRFVPAAWETGNRASEFMFIGMAFVVACAATELWDSQRAPWLGRVTVLCCAAIIFMGGVIAGWPPLLRLSKTLQVAVGHVTIEPQGFAAAQWMRTTLGPNNWVASDESNARLMMLYGKQLSLTSGYPDVQDLLGMPEFPAWQVQLIQDWEIQYLVFDRRRISWDNMAGYYFDETGSLSHTDTSLLDPEIYGKFEQVTNINRIFDSGNIVIYDVKALHHVASAQ